MSSKPLELYLQLGEIPDPDADMFYVFVEQLIDRRAVLLRVLQEREQSPDFIQSHIQRSAAAYELKPLQVRWPIRAIVRTRALGRG